MSTRTACARCGRPVEPGEHLCEQCREEAAVPVATRVPPEREADERRRRWPQGMPRPSPVQYHATVLVAVIAVLVGLAVFAFLNHRGVGPYGTSNVVLDERAPRTVAVTFTVTNEGSRASHANCHVTAQDTNGTSVGSATVLTDRMEPGASTTATVTIDGLSGPAAGAAVSCT